MNKSLANYMDELADMTPAPGGGSAAGCVGAIALSLISMVGRYAYKRQAGKNCGNRLNLIIGTNELHRKVLLQLMQKDETAYKKLSCALKKKDGSDLSRLYIESARVPMRICNMLIESFYACREILPYCSMSIITDLIEAAIFIEAAYKAAELNVTINLPGIKDQNIKRALSAKISKNRIALKKGISAISQHRF